MNAREVVDAEPTWLPSPLARRLLTVVGVAVVFAALAQHAAPVVFAAAPLLALATWVRGPRPQRLHVAVEVPQARTTEGSRGELVAGVELDAAGGSPTGGSVRMAVRAEPWVEVDDRVVVALGGAARGTWPLRAVRWGYWSPGAVTVRAVAPHRAWRADVLVEAPSVTVYPPASAAARVPRPPYLLSRLGMHVSRAPGAGIEFAGVREYQPGDPVRRVNWRLSTRRPTMMVNEFAQERMADVVVLIDSIRDLGRPGRSTVDLSVRGATAVVQAYLAHADRVGVVAFGSALRWLTPTTGTRHFYRIVETLLAARQARTYVDPSVDRLPRAVLPAGALVVCFSPLVDEIAIEAIRDLRERTHPVVVVDVLQEHDIEPVGGPEDLALRIWRLERRAITASLERIGVRVVPYAEIEGGSLQWLRLGGAR